MIVYSDAGPMVVTPPAPRTKTLTKVLVDRVALLAIADDVERAGGVSWVSFIRSGCFGQTDPTISISSELADRWGLAADGDPGE